MRGSRARDYAFVQNENRTFSKSTNYRADQFSLEREIPTVTNRACLGHIWIFLLLLGEIEKRRSVTRKTRETDSSSEESEGGEDNDVEEPVEVEKEEHSYSEEGKAIPTKTAKEISRKMDKTSMENRRHTSKPEMGLSTS